jgi:hypothetical protein
VVGGNAFIAALVVAREPSHELLRIGRRRRLHFAQELQRIVSAQGGGNAAVMEHFDNATFPLAEGKTKIERRGIAHCSSRGLTFELTCQRRL